MEHTEQQPDDASFGTRVRSAVIWRSGTQILGQIISWGSTLVILRILDPSDYGLFAMTQVILAFLAFMNGYFFASSLIQADTVEPHQIRQAFGMLLIINCALALLQLAIAPLAADYYNQPMVAELLRWQSLLLWWRSLLLRWRSSLLLRWRSLLLPRRSQLLLQSRLVHRLPTLLI